MQLLKQWHGTSLSFAQPRLRVKAADLPLDGIQHIDPFNGLGRDRRVQREVHLVELAPRKSEAYSGGGIVVQNVTGTVDLHSSGGSIDAQRLNGPSRLSTSGGSIDVADSTGDLDLRTSGGSIHLRDDDGKVDAHTSGGSISAELRANRGINLSTSGGNITVRLPQDTRGTIDAETSGGRVSSDFPLTATQSTDKDHLQGAIGGGGAPIELHTSGGNIQLEPR